MNKPKFLKSLLLGQKRKQKWINTKALSSMGIRQRTSQKLLVTSKTGTPSKSYIKAQSSKFGWPKIAVASLVMLASMFPFFPQKNSTPLSAINSVAVASAWGDTSINIWWPTDGATVSGVQPFKGDFSGLPVDAYRMYWQVDAGQLNEMLTNTTGSPHKEASVDLTGWTWKGSGPYTIGFVATDINGNKLAQKYETIYLNSIQLSPTPALQTSGGSPLMTTALASVETAYLPPATAALPTQHQLDVWWPANGAVLSGLQPFKTMLQQSTVGEYSMYWQVDGGPLSLMDTNTQDYPHKESVVNVSAWTWKGSGPYTITFIAKNNSGQEIGRNSVQINIQQSTAPLVQTVTQPTTTSNASANIFSGKYLYVNAYSDAKKQADAWRSYRPTDAAFMDRVASGAETQWFGNWNSNVQADVNNTMNTVVNTGALPVLVAYNIPNRDCGGWSSGGAGTADMYKQWIRAFAAGIGNRAAAVILEPDSTALINCLSSNDLQTRYALLKDAVSVLKANGQAVYIDAGHPGWVSASEMAARLQQSGVAQADGFALNIANFNTTQDNVNYGQTISSLIGGKRFVIDTGRNGNGAPADGSWCNPSGRALGQKPTTSTGNSLVDAYLWVKGPGGSDGYCNGGPAAGQFWADYALGLAQQANW